MLYPLKFKPRFKERIWGGDALATLLGKDVPEGKLIGESWEISAVQGDVSVVADGPLSGNSLEELAEIYMGDLLGEKVYEKYGIEFPLLIKFINARDDLSVQVHPDDDLAFVRHESYGKTEMWYILDAEPGAVLYIGFAREVSPQEYIDAVEAGTVASLLNRVEVEAGQAFFIPAGTIHAIGKGIVLAEIQQTSDITYRVYDWGRTDEQGNSRELHTELAVGAIDFAQAEDYDVTSFPIPNKPVRLVEDDHFTVALLKVDDSCERDYSDLDSFVIYICVEGSVGVCFSEGYVPLDCGETVLIPRQEDYIEINGEGTLLECYIDLRPEEFEL
jgi:Phosphomannose isomerase